MPMLLQMLKQEGIVVNTATMLEIDKILVNIDSAYYPDASELKYMLTPVISRNKEEQEIIYGIFDKINEKVYSGKKEEDGDDDGNNDGGKKYSKWKKVLVAAACCYHRYYYIHTFKPKA